MPWYYYSGRIPRAIPIKPGLSVALKPHTRLEIENDNSKEVRIAISKGVLRRCGKPTDSISLEDVPIVKEEDIKEVTEKSPLSKRIAEKGITFSKHMAPKKKGAVEYTDGEKKVAKKKQPNDESVEVLSEVDAGNEKEKKGR